MIDPLKHILAGLLKNFPNEIKALLILQYNQVHSHTAWENLVFYAS